MGRVCAHPKCWIEIPNDAPADKIYHDDNSCGRDARRIAANAVPMPRRKKRFWDGYRATRRVALVTPPYPGIPRRGLREGRYRGVLAALLLALAIVAGSAPSSADAYSNGRLPTSVLRGVFAPTAHTVLERDAAAAWNTMRQCAIPRGVDLYPGGPDSAYRPYGRQLYYRALYLSHRGNVAAIPGTSNHGWGNAVDDPAARAQAYIRKYGLGYRWSWYEGRRVGEAWHFTKVGRFGRPDPGTSVRYPILRRGSGGRCQSRFVKEAQRRLGVRADGELGRGTCRVIEKKLGKGCLIDSRRWQKIRARTRGISKPSELRTGDSVHPIAGIDVKGAQGQLNARFSEMGFPEYRVKVDGVFGKASRTAVCRYQRLRQVKATCKLDERTWALLREPAARVDWRALKLAVPSLTTAKAKQLGPQLGYGMVRHAITTRRRAAMYIAQTGHESGSFRYPRELWGPTAAQRSYAHRLGNRNASEGYRYRGGGWIQLTGRVNYIAAQKGLGVPLVSQPQLLNRPFYASLVAAWWWRGHGLNAIADTGSVAAATRRINGGLNGFADRQARYARASKVAARLVPKR